MGTQEHRERSSTATARLEWVRACVDLVHEIADQALVCVTTGTGYAMGVTRSEAIETGEPVPDLAEDVERWVRDAQALVYPAVAEDS